ncbi:MAG: YfcE family phosphodiesterase [Candidatus Hydrothermarchaeota archaeon]|nr:MAG: YfcE family phosphodiesterase [Candidatus Hydrothermarchaeota archaeon]
MLLVCISDLHGNLRGIERINFSPDLLIVAGDITNFGREREAESILKQLLKITDKILVVPGNCDYPEVSKVLDELEINLWCRGKIIDRIGFFGVGGSNPTPFNTPLEYSEEEIKACLNEGFTKVKEAEIKILVSHPPPYNTKVDRISSGLYVGSRAIREFIEKTQPSLVLCGHIHEARGIDKIKNTIIVNPGPLHRGYARVEIDRGEIKVEVV